MGDSAPISYRALLSVPQFSQLAGGTFLARAASQLWQISLVLFILQRFDSPELAGVAAFLALAPGLLLSPIAGALLDRHHRLRLIQLDFLLGAVSMGLVAALSLAQRLSPAMLLGIVAISSLTGPLSATGTRTLFPLVVPRPLWDRANAIDSASLALSAVVGPACAGFLVAWFGGEITFLVAASFLLTAGLILLTVQDPDRAGVKPEPLLASAWQTVGYVLRHATLRGIVVTLWAANLPYGILVVALPVLLLHTLHWTTGGVGALWSVAGFASVASGIVVGRINSEGRERRIIAVGMALAAVACLCISLSLPIPLVVGMALLGLSGGPIDLGLLALRQRKTDMRWYGRVFAVSMSLNIAGIPVGSALAGPIVERSVLAALLLATSIAVVGCWMPFLTIPQASSGERA
jgi:MFS family permease